MQIMYQIDRDEKGKYSLKGENIEAKGLSMEQIWKVLATLENDCIHNEQPLPGENVSPY